MTRAISSLLPAALLGVLALLTGCVPISTQTNTVQEQPPTSQATSPTAPNAKQAALFAGNYQVLGDAQAASTPRQLTLLPVAGTSTVQGSLLTQGGQKYPLSGTLNMQGPEQAQLEATTTQGGTLHMQLRREGQQVTLKGEYVQGSETRHMYSYKALNAAPATMPLSTPSTVVPDTTLQLPSFIQSEPLQVVPKTQSVTTSTSIPVFVTPTPGPLPK